MQVVRKGIGHTQLPLRKHLSLPTLSCSVLCLSAEAGTHAKLFWCFGGPERRALVPGMRR